MSKEHGPRIPNSIYLFYKDTKGCKEIYNILIANKREQIISSIRWRNLGDNFTDLEWNRIYCLCFKAVQERKFNWLQFQILHRIIPTNYYLHKLKLTDSPLCSFCKTDIETIDHHFYECFYVKELCCDIEEWFLNEFDISIAFDRKSVLFGKFLKPSIHKLHNFLSMVVKWYIFATKYKKTMPEF